MFAAFLASLPLNAANDVKDYERLQLLQQATGQDTASNSFETRMNALLDTSSQATTTYTSQANEDYRIAQETQKQQRETAAIDAKYQTVTPVSVQAKDPANANRLPVFRDDTRDAGALVDNSEAAYQQLLQDEAAKRDELKKQAVQPQAAAAQSAAAPTPTLAPSLANNPFYIAGSAGMAKSRQDYETSKPVIISRLVQNGYSRYAAEKMVTDASSSEDLIVYLMNIEGKTYGEASDLASTK